MTPLPWLQRVVTSASIGLLCFACASVSQAATPRRLWYRQPAERWDQALPLGNGRLGAMLFGGVHSEHLQLNEESLWAGEPAEAYPDQFAEHLAEVQRLVLDGKIEEARALGMAKLTKSPTSYRSYEPLGDLWIDFDHADHVQDYRRELNLRTGVASVRYTAGGVHFTRETLISAVDDVLAIRIAADRAGAVSFRVRLTRKKDMQVTSHDTDRLEMDGQIIDVASPEGYDDNRGGSGAGGAHMRFAGRLAVHATGGAVSADGDSLTIHGADEAVLLFTAATDYCLKTMTFDRSVDPGRESETILTEAIEKSWSDLLEAHTSEHRSLFNRVEIDLGPDPDSDLPTDARLEAVKSGDNDADLIELYFQYGRYLLMSSSRRPGRLPANLQGIWSERMWAPWEADYHLNINLQMNYWPADLCNLPETVEPLADWMNSLATKGRASAERLYGADGWVAFTTVNVFGRTTPGGSTLGSQFQNGVLDPLAGAWMSLTLWRHYEFTGDRRFLEERAYPVLKGASQFLLDYLVEDRDGRLVIVPSTSPENSYIHPVTGKAVRITKGSTYHMAVVRAVFLAVIEGAEILDVDQDYRQRLQAALDRMPAAQIGKDGTVQEWIEDYREREPGHRHVSHLIGLHPFSLITPDDEDLFAAAAATLDRRLSHGGGHTGWSRAWIINFYARLFDGEAAHEHVQMLLRKSTLPNLFDTHPPFQIDGNFGGCAGIAEMLLQSHQGIVQLLPALPTAWSDGSIRGLRARGGFIADMAWKDGKLHSYRLRATQDGVLRLKAGEGTVERDMKKGDTLSWP